MWLASVNADRVDPVVGRLSDTLLRKLHACLNAALDLP
jgi:hypothetical protein